MVERAGLENRNTRKRIVGSNPTLSAKILCEPAGFKYRLKNIGRTPADTQR